MNVQILRVEPKKSILQTCHIIRVMCSGRVDPQFVLEAFQKGASGVLILGCHSGDCHYKEGNFQAMKRYIFLKELLPQFGIEKDRLRLDWVSATETEKITMIVSTMVEDIRQMGPLGVRILSVLSLVLMILVETLRDRSASARRSEKQ